VDKDGEGDDEVDDDDRHVESRRERQGVVKLVEFTGRQDDNQKE
jgi:hypothetical protein